MIGLPYRPIHEQIVLGTCLKHEDVLFRLINRDDIEFGVEDHQLIWGGLQTMVERKLKYTQGTLETILPTEGWKGRAYLEKLYGKAEKDNIEYHLKQMQWDLIRIRLFSGDVAQLVNLLKDEKEDPNNAKQLTEKIGRALTLTDDDDSMVNNQMLIAKVQATLRARRIAKANFRTSGFPVLDMNLEEGFADRRLSVIAATSSTGKTTLMLNLARKQAMENDIKVGILAWEGGIQAAIDNMCAAQLGIPLSKFLKYAKKITDDEQDRIDDYVAELLGNDNLKFLKPPPKTIFRGAPWDVTNRLLDWVEDKFNRWGRDVIFWDLFLKKFPETAPDKVTQALNRVGDMIEEDGGSVNSHICLLHQINLKILEERKDKRPTRDVLKGTGTWVENPDLVLTLYRPALHEPGIEDDTLEITCWKQRRGPWPWRVLMDWDGPRVNVSGGKRVGMHVQGEGNNYKPRKYGSKV